MANKLPRCSSCDFCHKEPLRDGGKLFNFCHHPVWRLSSLKKRWIKSYDRGKTSPKWCPLRKAYHHDLKEE